MRLPNVPEPRFTDSELTFLRLLYNYGRVCTLKKSCDLSTQCITTNNTDIGINIAMSFLRKGEALYLCDTAAYEETYERYLSVSQLTFFELLYEHGRVSKIALTKDSVPMYWHEIGATPEQRIPTKLLFPGEIVDLQKMFGGENESI